MAFGFDLPILLAVIFLGVYYYLTSTFYFWRKRGVVGPQPKPLFGTMKSVILNHEFVADYVAREYHKYKAEPMFGLFAGRKPVLVIRDPDLIRTVLVKDFSAFADRDFPILDIKVDPLSQGLFGLESKRWRPLRINLSPVFTSGKLKEMFYLLMECAQHFDKFLDELTAKKSEIEVRDITAKFTTDVIGVCAFGLKLNAIAEEESEFRRVGRTIFEMTRLKSLKVKLKSSAPWLYRLLMPYFYERKRNDFFIRTMIETMEYRKKNNVKKNDIVDLLIEIKENPHKLADIELTDELITAQAFVFFLAGFETSSTTISNALYELALNQPIQDKLREEIIEELRNNDNTIKYETIRNMNYLHKVFNETLRKYPVLPVLLRRSIRDYTFEDMKVSIPQGTTVWIPVYAIQRDPEIYPNPETFDPERFTEEEMKKRHPSHFMPFGDGPRNCIGARFANYQSKVALIMILKKYRVEVCDKTCIPYVNNTRAQLLAPKEGITLKFTKLN